MLTAPVAEWRRSGTEVEFRGHRIHLRFRDGEGPPLVLLHGFPSSSYDWRLLLDELPGRAALAFDFLGFGLSDKPRGHVYGLAWQADLTAELVSRYCPGPVFLAAHDMGTSVATELFARELEGSPSIEIAGALLFNGSILLDRSSPTLGQKLLRSRLGPAFARVTSERFFRHQFGSIFSPEHPLSRQEAADQWSLLTHKRGHRLGHRLVHYMDERERFTERWHGAVRDWPGALSLAWGLLDPVATPAVLEGLRQLRPEVPVAELPDLGHYPQIEAPGRIAAALVEALERAAR